MKLKDLIKEYTLITEGRKEDARAKYPEVPEEIYNVFVGDDPSGNHKYIDWVTSKWESTYCQGYSTYQCHSESKATKLMENIKYFHENPHKYDIKDINQFKDLSEFNRSSSEAKIKLTKGEIKKQANKLYETDKYLIVEPTSHATSCFYGSGTRWCTTMRDEDSYFKQYYNHSSLFYFINKKNGKKRAFLTRLGRPMFGGSFNVPNYERHVGTIYTEADNVGRSMKGIPVEGRVAMAIRHKQKSLGKDDTLATKLKFGEPVITRVVDGDLTVNGGLGITEIPTSISKVNGYLSVGNGIASLGNVKEVGGNVSLISSDLTNTGNLERVGGNLKVSGGITNLGNIKYVGGRLDSYYNRNDTLSSLGDLEHVEIFDWSSFPTISLEQLQNVDYVGTIRVGNGRYTELLSNMRLPNLPDTPIELT